MEIRRIVPVIESHNLEDSKRFYGEFLELELGMDMEWVLNYMSKTNTRAQVIIVKSKNEQLKNANMSISIEVPDLDYIYDKAVSMGKAITYARTTEPWGVERFFVRDPNGITVNLMRHTDKFIEAKDLVEVWFAKWEAGDFMHLPISEHFSHTSPFGTINGKKEYLKLVDSNRDKFLGYEFVVRDGLYERDRACVRYTAIQGDFKLDVSEWYLIKDNLIDEIISHYHIGEIREDRKLAE